MKTQARLAAGLIAALLFVGCSALPRCRPVAVAPGIFAGCKPSTQQDFDTLQRQGIRTILSLETMPWDIWPERKSARQAGFVYRHVSILASPFEPHEAQVKQALLTLADASLRPIFLHCLLGEDRNVFIIGLYRIYYLHWTPQAAWDEMLRSGFHSTTRLRGFTTYFWKHTQVPDWAKGASDP